MPEDQDHKLSNLEITRLAHEVEERDFQLWSIVVLCVIVLGAGVAALAYPILEEATRRRWDGSMLPQLVFGLTVLIVLFNIYLLQQRRELRRTREDLLHELLERQQAEKLSLLDPLTQAYNRRYMDEVMTKDLSRLDRNGVCATFLMIDIDDFKNVNTQFGHLVGDRVLAETAALMKKAFRAADTIIRFGGDEFLVLLEGATLEQAQAAVSRLEKIVAAWNSKGTIKGFHLSLSCGMALYEKGSALDDVLLKADEDMYSRKNAAEVKFEASSSH